MTARDIVADHYHAIRATTEALCRPLEIEDYGVQSMDEYRDPASYFLDALWQVRKETAPRRSRRLQRRKWRVMRVIRKPPVNIHRLYGQDIGG